MNKTLHKELETVFIPTRQELCHISSTLIKKELNIQCKLKIKKERPKNQPTRKESLFEFA